MSKLTGRNVVNEAMAMSDDVREQIRNDILHPKKRRLAWLSASKVLSAVASVFIIGVIAAGGWFIFNNVISNGNGSGTVPGVAQETSLAPTTMMPQVTTAAVGQAQVTPISLNDLDYKIYSTDGLSAVIDDITVYSVVRTDDINGISIEVLAYTNYVWTQPDDASQLTSILPSLTLVYDDGTQKALSYHGGVYAPGGASYIAYRADNLPDSSTFEIQSAAGGVIPVTLAAVTDANSPHSSVIKIGGTSLSVVPIPGPWNVLATEFSDPFTQDIMSNYNQGGAIEPSFKMVPDGNYVKSDSDLLGFSGDSGFAGLGILQSGYCLRPVSPAGLNVSLSQVSLLGVDVYAYLYSMSSFTVPDDGQTIALNYPLFSMDNIQFNVTSITNQGGTLSIQTETIDNSGNPYRSPIQFFCSVYSQKPGAAPLDVQAMDASYNPLNPIVVNDSGMNPGDEFGFNLMYARYTYGWCHYTDPTNTNPPIYGTIDLQ